MITIDQTFHLPNEFAAGLASGRLRLFGGVLRDAQTGRVVKHLEPVSKRTSQLVKDNPKLAAGAILTAVVVGGAVLVSTRFSKKARLARRLAAVDVALSAAIARRPSMELTREDLLELQASIDEFLRLTDLPEYKTVRLTVEESAIENLFALAKALRSFSEQLALEAQVPESVPELPSSRTRDLLPLMQALGRQLEYQQRNWPAARTETDATPGA